MLSPQCIDMIKKGEGPKLLSVWSAVDGFIGSRLGEPPIPTTKTSQAKRKSFMAGRSDAEGLTGQNPA